MREIVGYGGVEFGPFSLHLKDGDPNDLPVSTVNQVIEQWTDMVRYQRTPLAMLEDEIVEDRNGHQFVISAPSMRDVQDRKIYLHYIKTRPVQPMKFKVKFDYSLFTRASRRTKDGQKWWRHLVG